MLKSNLQIFTQNYFFKNGASKNPALFLLTTEVMKWII